jgi:chemotaxis protein histidine kinase CheA
MDEEQLVIEFVDEAREHLADIEAQLLQIEALGSDFDDDLVNTVFRAIHSIKGAAGFLGLQTINRLSHSLENVLGKFREHKIIPDPYNVDVLLKGADRLRSLNENVSESNHADVSELVAKIDAILEEESKGKPARGGVSSNAVPVASKPIQASEKKAKAPRKTRTAATRKTKEPAELSSDDSDPSTDCDEEHRSGSEVADACIETVDLTASSVGEEIQQDHGHPAEPGDDHRKSAAKSAAKRTTPEASIRVGVRVSIA